VDGDWFGTFVESYRQGKTEVLGEKPLPMALGTPFFHFLKIEINLSSYCKEILLPLERPTVEGYRGKL
jgi:hypothetical protein